MEAVASISEFETLNVLSESDARKILVLEKLFVLDKKFDFVGWQIAFDEEAFEACLDNRLEFYSSFRVTALDPMSSLRSLNLRIQFTEYGRFSAFLDEETGDLIGIENLEIDHAMRLESEGYGDDAIDRIAFELLMNAWCQLSTDATYVLHIARQRSLNAAEPTTEIDSATLRFRH